MPICPKLANLAQETWYFITKTRLFKYIENYTIKNENFQIKINLIFIIFLLKT